MNLHLVADSAVDIRGLSIAFDQTSVLDDVSFSLCSGEITVLVGPSGAGKSTLLHAIAGVLAPVRGEVRIGAQGASIGNLHGRRDISFVFQEPLLFPWRNILRNVEFGLEGIDLSRAERRSRANAALKLVNLSDQAAKWPHQLSGGQRQRIGLARALAVEPTLLLMDEPFAALDPKNRAVLQNELLDLVERQRMSVLFVTHDMSEAIYLADRILVLSERPARIVLDIRVDDPRPRSRNSHHPLIEHLHGTFGLQNDKEKL
ncbi:MAG: ABC transporter ATP-binding protein [Afipia sp.]|nr:ABC transporter ATP-binding protein [Afipia sp.]